MITNVFEWLIRAVLRLLELIGQYYADDVGLSSLYGTYFPSTSREFGPVEAYVAKGIGDIERFLGAWPGQFS